MDRISRQKIDKEKLVLNNTLDKILLQNSRIHILFKYIWNILQHRSYGRPQNKSQ